MPRQRSNTHPQLEATYRELLAARGHDLPFQDHAPSQIPTPGVAGGFDPRAAQDAIRFLESQRGYTSFETVGTEPSANYLERLASVARRKGPYLGDALPHLQEVLDDQVAQLHDWLGELGIELPFPVFVGVFPSGELNARTVPVPDVGSLILVNAGLMDLMFVVLKVNLATSGSPDSPPLLKREQAAMVLAEAFNAYLFGQGSLDAWAIPRLDPVREHFLAIVLRLSEMFVVAHELGHIACGHISIGAGARPQVHGPHLEHEADEFAVRLMLAAVDANHPDDEAPLLVGGIASFLVVAGAVQRLETTFLPKERARTSHPVLDERATRVLVQLAREYSSLDPTELVRSAATFKNWLDSYLVDVQGWLKRVEELMRRPGRFD